MREKLLRAQASLNRVRAHSQRHYSCPSLLTVRVLCTFCQLTRQLTPARGVDPAYDALVRAVPPPSARLRYERRSGRCDCGGPVVLRLLRWPASTWWKPRTVSHTRRTEVSRARALAVAPIDPEAPLTLERARSRASELRRMCEEQTAQVQSCGTWHIAAEAPEHTAPCAAAHARVCACRRVLDWRDERCVPLRRHCRALSWADVWECVPCLAWFSAGTGPGSHGF
jgi:hypothetical protein